MSLRTLSRLLLAGAAIAAAGTVFAQGPRHGMGPGKDRPELPVSVADMEKRLAERSAAIDADKDGFVTAAEMQAHREAMRAERMRQRLLRHDADGDGRVSVAEFEASRRERIARMDANGDGMIDEDEMRAHHRRGGHMKRGR